MSDTNVLNVAAVAGLTRKEMESRRMIAAGMLDSGFSQATVARACGVSRTSACRWKRAIERSGQTGLKLRPPPGRPARLTPIQWQLAREILAAAPPSSWTTGAFCVAIKAACGVEYSPDHAGRIMHKLGWPPQPKGRRRAARP